VQNLNITFVGGGNMARSLASGLLGAGLSAGRVRVSDPDAAQRGRFESFGIETFVDNDRAVAGSDVIVMAVKPQLMGRVLEPLDVGAALVVSIAAGVPLSALAAWTSPDTAIVRCMPNTPALLGAGMTGLFANPRVTPAQR
jgi:pyrroline-5-carboxylate reductase